MTGPLRIGVRATTTSRATRKLAGIATAMAGSTSAGKIVAVVSTRKKSPKSAQNATAAACYETLRATFPEQTDGGEKAYRFTEQQLKRLGWTKADESVKSGESLPLNIDALVNGPS